MMRISRRVLTTATLIFLAAAAGARADGRLVSAILGIEGEKFTVNGEPTFLLGVSYFDTVGWRESDLDHLAARGFNLIRIWLDWQVWEGRARSTFDANGTFTRAATVIDLVQACAARGIVVDVTILDSASVGSPHGFPDIAAATKAVRAAVSALRGERNVLFDLANEHNVGTQWAASDTVLRSLIAAAHEEDPDAIVTYSISTPTDGSLMHVAGAALGNGVQLLAPHFDRTADWHERTASRTASLRAYVASRGRAVPIYLQEEARRGWQGQFPTQSEFLQAARTAREGGAAGWVFHTDAGFDLSRHGFFDNLDAVERSTIDQLARALGRTAQTDERGEL